MSIYATCWEMKLETGDYEWVTVYAQAVPGHIGHPSHYPDGDPYSDFLPPVVKDIDTFRAVFILVEGYDEKEGQRYVRPLLSMTGEEYNRATFRGLIDQIQEKMRELSW